LNLCSGAWENGRGIFNDQPKTAELSVWTGKLGENYPGIEGFLTYMTELSVLIIFVVGCADAYVFQAYLRRHERDYTFAQKEIVDLQKQVNVKRIIISDD
jgi:hypothetical protein